MNVQIGRAAGVVFALAAFVACVDSGSSVAPPAQRPTTSSTSPPTATEPVPPMETAPSTVPATEPSTSLSEPIDMRGAEVPLELVDLARFVEATRGHSFLRPVTVELVPDERFEDLIVESFRGATLDALDTQYELLVLIGLLPDGIDYIDLIRLSDRESVIGFYLPGHDELYLRGAELTPFVSMVAVHELTHALDDQQFNLAGDDDGDDAGDGAANGDVAFARAALAEGSATWVEERWIESRPVDDRVAIRAAGEAMWMTAEHADWPISATEIGEDVYSLGGSFVADLLADGGLAALDAAFIAPPSSTEQLLHVDRFRSGDDPIDVPTPDAEGRIVSEGSIGELLLVVLMSASISPSAARAAAEGWGGDRYVVAEDGGRRCLVLEVRMDTAADEVELTAAAGRWAARQPDADVSREAGVVRITSCRATTA